MPKSVALTLNYELKGRPEHSRAAGDYVVYRSGLIRSRGLIEPRRVKLHFGPTSDWPSAAISTRKPALRNNHLPGG
jgi:hypothetical protein